MSRTFAYLRVSTADQTTDNQLEEIAASGFSVHPRRVIRETISGSVPANQRPAFGTLVAAGAILFGVIRGTLALFKLARSVFGAAGA